MFILLMLLAFLPEERAQWLTEDTGVFRPLVRREVAVDSDGTLYITLRDRACVAVYGSNGKLLRLIGSKGMGPGELMIPTWVWLEKNQLYVEDARTKTISVFGKDGSYLNRILLPEGNDFKKVKNGWVYGDWELETLEPNRSSSLFFGDVHLEHPVSIHNWPYQPDESSAHGEGSAQGKLILPINPAADIPQLAISRDGLFAYFLPQGKDDIHIFDLAAKKLLKIIENHNKPLPFNSAWGDQMLENAQNAIAPSLRNIIVFKKNYPSHFPLVNELNVMPNGDIAMALWTAWKEKDPRIQVFDAKGNPKKSPYSAKALVRIFGEVGDLAYVSVYDQDDEEGQIAAVPKAKVNAFVEANPIEYRGLTGDSVVLIDVD